jgi:hypothetical protein
MEQTIDGTTNLDRAALAIDDAAAVKPSYRAFQILRVGFTLIPIVAGADKFFHFLVDWDKYLPPFVNQITGGRGKELMFMAGAIEIVAGVGVWVKPKIFAYVVAGWLLLIILNLLIISNFDTALRDFGLALGAVVLGQLSQEFSKRATERLVNKITSRDAK